MPRPKSDDPTVTVTVRVKSSTKDWWDANATQGRSAGQEMARALEARAEKDKP